MALVCVTDAPYKRDFYHWILQGHCEGFTPPEDEGFEWKVEDGPTNNISIGYPKNPFWYELGNNPNYLSSRKIYYYRAWQEYKDGEDLIKVFGSWVQFTSINPMCTGFTNFEAKKIMRKYYSYHGEIRECATQPEPGTFVCVPAEITGPPWELVLDAWPVKNGIWSRNWDTMGFLPSSNNDTCLVKFPDGKKRYVFFEIDYYNGFIYEWGYSLYNNGSMCEETKVMADLPLWYLASSNTIWYGAPWMMGLWFPKSPTHVRIWRSSTGEYPGAPPI